MLPLGPGPPVSAIEKELASSSCQVETRMSVPWQRQFAGWSERMDGNGSLRRSIMVLCCCSLYVLSSGERGSKQASMMHVWDGLIITRHGFWERRAGGGRILDSLALLLPSFSGSMQRGWGVVACCAGFSIGVAGRGRLAGLADRARCAPPLPAPAPVLGECFLSCHRPAAAPHRRAHGRRGRILKGEENSVRPPAASSRRQFFRPASRRRVSCATCSIHEAIGENTYTSSIPNCMS